ncbi:hypothetical protein [Paraburkholderia pallida]|uniref:Uncharacterized protein n=1 Tax=Paraburkholderia pallida TaxID=2547399 RepID=A0A4P7CZL2_9BURK|nr:hypothetical protein [Paraburkholderia pallida]QBQ99694.1 hypothetical protein E1956_21325 [Paraburkholderia pallida]
MAVSIGFCGDCPLHRGQGQDFNRKHPTGGHRARPAPFAPRHEIAGIQPRFSRDSNRANIEKYPHRMRAQMRRYVSFRFLKYYLSHLKSNENRFSDEGKKNAAREPRKTDEKRPPLVKG